MKKIFVLILILLTSLSGQNNFWHQTNGPAGSSIRSISTNSAGYIFCATSGGVYRSTNNGDNWSQINNGLHYPYLMCIAAGQNGIVLGGGDGVYRSTDNGDNWTKIDTMLNYYTLCLAVSQDGYIFAGAAGGIYRSTDEGETWSKTDIPGSIIESFAFSSEGNMIVGNFTGLYLSTDKGISWNVTGNWVQEHIFSMIFANSGKIFAGTGFGVYRSDNNGMSWTQLNNPAGQALAISSNGDIVSGGNGGIFRSSDDGDTWVQLNEMPQIEELCSNSKGYLFAGTYEQGLFYSTDNGNNWAASTNGLTDIHVYSIVANPAGFMFAGGVGGGVFRSSDNGNEWVALNVLAVPANSPYLALTPDGYIFAVGPDTYHSNDNGEKWTKANSAPPSIWSLNTNSKGYLFAGTYGLGIYRSTDKGNSWSEINNGLTELFVPSIAASSNGDIFAGTGSGVFRSTDDGESWQDIGLKGNYVHSLAVNSGGDIFAGTGDMNFFFPTEAARIFRSPVNNISWTMVKQIDSSTILSLTVNTKGNIYAGALFKGMFSSTDNGNTWLEINNGLANPNVLSLAMDSSGYLYAGTFGGVFRSNSSTISDSSVLVLSQDSSALYHGNTMMPIKWVSSHIEKINLEYTADGTKWDTIVSNFYAFRENYKWLIPDRSSQLCKIRISDAQNPSLYDISDEYFTITSILNEYPDQIFESFELFQNYPNPFNPSTIINYQIPEEGLVMLKIYDILGKELKTLVNEQKHAGSYNIKFDASGLSSGIYIYQIRAGNFIQSRKMILIK